MSAGPIEEFVRDFPGTIKLIFNAVEKLIRERFKEVSVETKADYKFDVLKPSDWPSELPEPHKNLSLFNFLVKGIRMGNVEVDGLWSLYIGSGLEKNSIVVYYKTHFKIDHDSNMLLLKLDNALKHSFYIRVEGRKLQKAINEIIIKIAQWLDHSLFAQKQSVVALTL